MPHAGPQPRVLASGFPRPFGGCRGFGRAEADKRGGNVGSRRIDAHRELIFGWITEKPDITLAEVGERLDDAVGYRPLPSIVSRFFKRHGLTRKKRLLMLPSKSDRM